MRSRYKLLKWVDLGDEMGAKISGFEGLKSTVWGAEMRAETGGFVC